MQNFVKRKDIYHAVLLDFHICKLHNISNTNNRSPISDKHVKANFNLMFVYFVPDMEETIWHSLIFIGDPFSRADPNTCCKKLWQDGEWRSTIKQGDSMIWTIGSFFWFENTGFKDSFFVGNHVHKIKVQYSVCKVND